ncbi:MAG: 4'-phosphopantetheinyl transferase family protein [Leptolyngbyaceae cyanobacterium]
MPFQLAHPHPQETHLWQLHLPTATVDLALCESWLSPTERDRAQRLVRSAARHQFIVSRAGLRYLLAAYLGCTPTAVQFDYGAYGRPELSHTLAGLQFNLAHSSSWVIYGVGHCQWLGVDVEQVRPHQQLEALTQRCLTPVEQATVPSTDAERLERFLQYWTVKEAHLKAVGLGLSYPMTAVQVSLQPTPQLVRPAQVSGVTTTQWQTQLWCPDATAIAAVCVGQPTRFVRRDWPGWPDADESGQLSPTGTKDEQSH